MKKYLLVFLILAGVGLGMLFLKKEPLPSLGTKQSPNADSNKKDQAKKAFSIDDPISPWVVINKRRPLPSGYVPNALTTPSVTLNNEKSPAENQVKKEVASDLENLFKEAKAQGHNLMLASGYRSFELQATYFNNYAANEGREAAEKYSARPGTSEHQTGWALDISKTDRKCYLQTCFGDTAEGIWLANNAYRFGFTLRYAKGKEQITGYQYEPWHFRYVGNELALNLKQTGQSLEEYFNLTN